ncbi:6-hydroxymethylpterin diphosphokinase MptE-like protein [Planctobacterium marinum]|uniref:DUF115 domain-containing protein n=1 Tax=Planctobacterium marinum TaxID=1631968 RepID=A0AA48HIY5_9ALTE|nr:hypothetical protein MACH26_32690 [Planctobacterium marinum]
MLKNIQLHLSKDQQEEIEAELSPIIEENRRQSINAFQRYVPSLFPLIASGTSDNISIFCNERRDLNIVDYGLGRTFYGPDPINEVHEHFTGFTRHAWYRAFNELKSVTESVSEQLDDFRDLNIYKQLQRTQELPQKLECVVVLGCGLGHHLEKLVKEYQVEHVIVYEPEIQFFRCSGYAVSWKDILETAKKKNTNLYLQIGKDSRDLISDLRELKSSFGVAGFYIYKHYNHPIFDAVFHQVLNKSWSDLQEHGFSFADHKKADNYVPPWTYHIELDNYRSASKDDVKFQKNLSAFRTYFPAIADEFEDYNPTNWLPIQNLKHQQINLLNTENLCCWYSDEPKQDSLSHLEVFADKPNKDGLVLGYTGKKLAHYQHYKFVKEAEGLLDEVEEEFGALPENIQSLIQFGLGCGYQLESLLQEHEIENLFISEPIRDFFYASLFAIDWCQIFKKTDELENRLYINIGDDGSNLFKDLLQQFYSIGPYILNNTYFYSGYYNSNLKSAIAQLREQLKLVISIGEYFDHAYYGITHTVEGVKRQFPILKKNAQQVLSVSDRETPVFLVGNGPSLDASIQYIKEVRDSVILVTCGTSLQVMYKNGIVPDFHAEIEQNRATYDWATLINAPEFLKKISLVSCNGIHPDTARLYKDVFVAFKDGESSTVSTLSVLGEDKCEMLQFAFPTVSNFATNLFIQLGMENIYFFGVDLGFYDNKHHHSKQSAYYNRKGTEVFDYGKANNTALVTRGNFRQTVFTKEEFKIANVVLSQSISACSKNCNFYNCSDGALINGASPLQPDLVLVSGSEAERLAAVNRIKTDAFFIPDNKRFTDIYTRRYVPELTKREMELFVERFDQKIDSAEEAKEFINQQKEVLFDSYSTGRSMLFFYLFGTVNFANAFLTKLLYSSKTHHVELFNRGIQICKSHFQGFKKVIEDDYPRFDKSVYNLVIRRVLKLGNIAEHKKIVLLTNVHSIGKYFKDFIETIYCWKADVKVYVYHREVDLPDNINADYIIYCHCNDTQAPTPQLKTSVRDIKVPFVGNLGTLVCTGSLSSEELNSHLRSDEPYSLMLIPQDPSPVYDSDWIAHAPMITKQIIMNCFSGPEKRLIMPKLMVRSRVVEESQCQRINLEVGTEATLVSYPQLVYGYADDKTLGDCIDINGDPGMRISAAELNEHRIDNAMSDEEYAAVIPRWSATMNNREEFSECQVELIQLN